MSALYPSNPSNLIWKSKLIDSWAAEALAAGTHTGPTVEVPRGAQNIYFTIEGITADRTTGNETYDVEVQGRTRPDLDFVDIPGLDFTQIATASPSGEVRPTATNAPNVRVPRYLRSKVVTAGTTPILTAKLYMHYSLPRGPGEVVDHGAVS